MRGPRPSWPQLPMCCLTLLAKPFAACRCLVKEPTMTTPLMMGAVAYAPKVVTIWEGFKEYFRQHDFEFDYILYSNYERQVEAQFDGSIAIAWNSPLAWVRADRIARSRGQLARAVEMRDTDRDLTSVLVVRSDLSL